MAKFVRTMLKPNGAAVYKMEGSTIPFNAHKDMFEGEAPKEIEINAEGLHAPWKTEKTTRAEEKAAAKAKAKEERDAAKAKAKEERDVLRAEKAKQAAEARAQKAAEKARIAAETAAAKAEKAKQAAQVPQAPQGEGAAV